MLQKKDRATRDEVQIEIEARMHLLKLDDHIISHQGNGEVFYSFANKLFPLTAEMEDIIGKFSKDMYQPYHVIYSENAKTLYVLNVSLDKADWSAERDPIGKALEIPCDVIHLDSRTHETGTAPFASIAEIAFHPSQRRPVSVGEDSFPDFRNAWLSIKKFFENR